MTNRWLQSKRRASAATLLAAGSATRRRRISATSSSERVWRFSVNLYDGCRSRGSPRCSAAPGALEEDEGEAVAAVP